MPASSEFCCLPINFANSLNSDQAQQNVGPDLDPSSLTLLFLKEYFEKVMQRTKIMKNYPACKELKNDCVCDKYHYLQSD